MRKSMANGKEDGTGIRARAMAEGKCVNTIVCQRNLVQRVLDRCGGAYLDVSDAFGNRRGDEHGNGRYDARCEEE
jgi:hypothetical protein